MILHSIIFKSALHLPVWVLFSALYHTHAEINVQCSDLPLFEQTSRFYRHSLI